MIQNYPFTSSNFETLYMYKEIHHYRSIVSLHYFALLFVFCFNHLFVKVRRIFWIVL